MRIPGKIKIVEVGPRDGLQNEKQSITADHRINLIHLLQDAGLRSIESGSFTSAKWVPQMANTQEVMAGIKRKDDVSYAVLVPNLRGLDDAIEASVEEISIFAAATESFSEKNINCSIAESIARFMPVVTRATASGIRVRGYVSCVLGCPYEGDVDVNAVARISRTLYEMGCYEISLGDTIGSGTPGKARQMIEKVSQHVPVEKIAGHFHDTYGQALANIYAVMEMGVATVDSSVAGLGGCPYAVGATGNVATEDVLYMLNGMGIETGVDMDKLLAAGSYISGVLDRKSGSRVANALSTK